ncbi:heavy metal translocating P-type ATPase [Treponema sp.]
MTKYKLKGLDCAQCANDVEWALQKVAGLESARVSFATGSVFIDETFEKKAKEIIARLEPGAELLAPDSFDGEYHLPANTSAGITAGASSLDREGKQKTSWLSYNKKQLILLSASAILLLIGSIFNAQLHATPFAIAEYVVLLSAFLLVGFPVLKSAAVSLLRGQVFNEMFLMSIATLGAIAIHQLPEAVGVMLFYSVGEYLQNGAVDKSRKSIAALMDTRPETARLFEDGSQNLVRASLVEVGALVEVLPGERIPLDGVVTEGSSYIDTSSMTGESVPRAVEAGAEVLAGFVNDEGRLLVRVTKTYGQTAVARILELVENAATHKAPTEKFISRFAAVYTPIVVAIAAIIAFLPPLLIPGALFSEWIYRALVILVISCPCALVISIPLGYFGGIGGASRNKLLIKGSNYIDALNKVDTVVFDKTGTLTEGVFMVDEVVTRNGFSKEELLSWAAAAESHSSHPIARSIRDAGTALAGVVSATRLREIKGHGVVAEVAGHSIIVGNDRLLHREHIEHGNGDCGAEGTLAYIAVDGIYAGYIRISDRIKTEAASTIAQLKTLGIQRLVMLSGDAEKTAAFVARSLGIDEYYAELLPEDKVHRLEELQKTARKGQKTAFIGDGMNDAPVLVRSDIGFAMGALGSDAAIEAADIVVMDDHLGRVPQAFRIARFTRKIVLQNIVLAMGVKLLFITLGSFGIANMWEAVIGDVGVALLAVLNAMRTMRYAGKGSSR